MPRLNLIQIRKGTAAEWASADPILAAGEPGFITDTNEIVIGDGTTAFSGLSPISGGGGGLTSADIDTIAEFNAIVSDGNFATETQLNTKSDSGLTYSPHSGAYTLSATELTMFNQGDSVIVTQSTSGDLTVPTNATLAVSVGTTFGVRDFANVVAAGGVTITSTSGSLAIPSGTTAYLEKTATNTWLLHNGSATEDATDSVKGIVELATTAETTTGTDTTRAVTPAGVKAAIDALIAAAPGALNTLDELAAALGDDANFASTVTTSLAGKEPLLTSASASTASGTITLDMNSLRERMFVGSATFDTSKTMALSNATNALVFNFHFEVTNVAATLVMPASWVMSDIRFASNTWVPQVIGKYEMGGSYDGTNWKVKIIGPFV